MRTSAGLIVFGILNILVALLPPCAGCVGTVFFITDEPMPMELPNGHDVGFEMKDHLDRKVPHAKYEAFTNAACNGFFALLLIVGAVGLFLAQGWGRWVTIAAAFFLILTFCVHDIYQLAIYRPAMMEVFDRNLAPGAERDGFKAGFTASFFFWSCTNPLVMMYLVGMSIFLLVTSAFDRTDDDRPRRRRRRGRDRWDDDEDDDDY